MSKNNFKINIHDTLLQKLSDEHDYIDLADLVTEISRTLAFLNLYFLLAIYMTVNLILLRLASTSFCKLRAVNILYL